MSTDLPSLSRPLTPGHFSARQRLVGLWDRVSLYVPLLLMGVLALATYWLTRNTSVLPAAVLAAEARHDIDYFLRNFSIKSYDATGALKSELYGVEARHYLDTDILEIDLARLRNISVAGDVVNAAGDKALSNYDGSEVQLVGNAVVVREPKVGASTTGTVSAVPRLEFRGDFLHVFLNEERVSSYKPVVLIHGSDQFSGDTFEYNHLDGTAELKGRVKGLLLPRAAALPAR